MPRYRITTIETTTYGYWVTAESEDDALNWLEGEDGKELDHEVEVVSIERVDDKVN